MKTALAFCGWFLLLAIPLLSYLSFRFLPGRGPRLKAYAFLLLVIMVVDMFRVSFVHDWVDVGLSMAVWFMVGEFFWLLTPFKSRRVMGAAIAVAGLLYLIATFGWVRMGPLGVLGAWDSRVVSSYERQGVRYRVKEREAAPRFTAPARLFTLERTLPKVPLMEQCIGTYTTPSGYYRSIFSFVWHPTEKGVRSDVMVDDYLIWTMGEGF